jgi:hypothetical protein
LKKSHPDYTKSGLQTSGLDGKNCILLKQIRKKHKKVSEDYENDAESLSTRKKSPCEHNTFSHSTKKKDERIKHNKLL